MYKQINIKKKRPHLLPPMKTCTPQVAKGLGGEREKLMHCCSWPRCQSNWDIAEKILGSVS